MSLADVVRNGVAIASSVVDSLKVSITVDPWNGTYDDYGKPNYGTPVAYTVIQEDRLKHIRRDDGVVVLGVSKLIFLERVAINSLDKITLPDGTVAPIVVIEGFPDADLGGTFYKQVWVGLGTRDV